MFFPFRDDNPRILVPYVTYGIIAINVLVFLFSLGLSGLAEYEFTLSWGLIRRRWDTYLRMPSFNLTAICCLPVSINSFPWKHIRTIR